MSLEPNHQRWLRIYRCLLRVEQYTHEAKVIAEQGLTSSSNLETARRKCRLAENNLQDAYTLLGEFTSPEQPA